MKMRLISFYFFCLLILSCSKKSGDEEVLIRVFNNRAVNLDDVRVFSMDAKEAKYGTVSPGTVTGYKGIGSVSGFPLCQFILPGYGRYEQAGLRCGNEPLLGPGRYSLIIDNSDNISDDSPVIYFLRD